MDYITRMYWIKGEKGDTWLRSFLRSFKTQEEGMRREAVNLQLNRSKSGRPAMFAESTDDNIDFDGMREQFLAEHDEKEGHWMMDWIENDPSWTKNDDTYRSSAVSDVGMDGPVTNILLEDFGCWNAADADVEQWVIFDLHEPAELNKIEMWHSGVVTHPLQIPNPKSCLPGDVPEAPRECELHAETSHTKAGDFEVLIQLGLGLGLGLGPGLGLGLGRVI